MAGRRPVRAAPWWSRTAARRATTKTAPPATATSRLRDRVSPDESDPGCPRGRAAGAGRRVRRDVTAGWSRRTAASAIATTNPIATGVNELRPPEATAAHHAIEHEMPDGEADPERLAGWRVRAQEPDPPGHPDAEQQADRTDQEALARSTARPCCRPP